MNRIAFIAAALSIAAAAPVMAQEATPDTWTTVASTTTRAQVQAELAQARANGGMAAFKSGYIEPVRTAQSRADVRAQTVAALASGQIAAINARVPGLNLPTSAGVASPAMAE